MPSCLKDSDRRFMRVRSPSSPQCGLSSDYLSGPKGADNSAEDLNSQDSIFVTPASQSLIHFGWYACRGVKIRFVIADFNILSF